jgi:ATP-dependent RNA helicase RhlE
MSPHPEQGFHSLGLLPQLTALLDRQGFKIPTPIQARAIPLLLKGGDLIGLAQTGTGKTLAFGLPTIQYFLGHSGRALILVPTRELAVQVAENLRAITRLLQPGIRSTVLIGGEPIYRQIRELQRNPHIIIATPGRLVDHLKQKTITLETVKILIFDEADRMFDMGFAPQIREVLTHLPTERQTLLFSATMSPEVRSLTQGYLKNPSTVEVAPAGTTAENIEQEICYVRRDNKFGILQKLLSLHQESVLVFTRTKHGAAKLTHALHHAGFTAAEIHSNRSLGQRRMALEGFKQGRYRVLVATDIAARGIDVQNIQLVVNYDLPDASEDYVHRIGRTGRAGKSGKAISLADPEQVRDVRTIERLLGRTLPLSVDSIPLPTFQRSQSYSPKLASVHHHPQRRFSSNRRRR